MIGFAPVLLDEGRDILRQVSALDFASETPEAVSEVHRLQAAIDAWRAQLMG